MSKTERIKQLIRKQVELVDSIVGTREMIRGSLNRIYRKCGKSYCWCAREQGGHPLNSIGWKQGSKSKTRSIPKQDMPWAERVTENRKRFRKQRQELRALQKELGKEINEFEKEIVDATTAKKPWLK